MRLSSLNQMYYDIIKETNLDNIRNNSNNNNNNLNFQSLDFNQNYRLNNIPQNYDDIDYMIKNYIEGERNKNINDFNNSMIDINKKITNYLIDNCIKEKEKNLEIEKINHKLDKINKIQKMQKDDIDFIIKYGLNKNRALEPIVGMLLDHPKPLPKLLRDDDEIKNKLEKQTYKLNLTPLKNFSVYGRYTNKKPNNENIKGNTLRRTGSSIFEYNYKIDEDEDPHKYDHNIYPNYSKRPVLEKVKSSINFDEYISDKNKNKNSSSIDNNRGISNEKDKFHVYKDRFYLPADFRFGGGKINKNNSAINDNKQKEKIKFFIE